MRYPLSITVAAIGAAFCLLVSFPAHAAGPDRAEKLLEELTNAPGIPGQEEEVRRIVIRELRALGAEVSTDGLGSAIGVLRGSGDGPRIMLAAHLDELGLMVKHITAEGLVKFIPLGGFLDHTLVDKRWVIHTTKGPVKGVSGIKTIHVMPPEERTKMFPRDQLFIDVGARSRAEAEGMGIRPGQAITADSRFERLGEGAYTAKAFDDRVGLAVMLESARRLSPAKHANTIFAVATTQEEIGLRGAKTSSQVVKPDIGISIEAGVAGDFPGMGPDLAQERLGGGPGIYLHDASTLPNLKLRDFFFRVAGEKKIPLQPELLAGYGDDSAEMQKWSTGTPTVNMTVPVRYLHSFNGVIRREDFDKAIDLLVEVVLRMDKKTVEELRRFD